MSLRLRAALTRQIHADLCRAYPEEGCGVLLGRDDGETREVVRAVTFDNQREDSRHNRYVISPEQFLGAELMARDEGLDVIGFYHSHPDHPARPSDFDREHAWPWYSYLIVSVMQGKAAETTSWRLGDDRSRFESEPMENAPDATAPGAVETTR
jgi:proteasome lid subunit RPN8/RPN11